MRSAAPLRFGAVFLLVSTVFASCSDGTDDSLVNACKLIVETCHEGTAVGQCLDDLGSASPDCIDCIGAHHCDYAACQADVPGCRIPPWLLDAKDVIDAGPTPVDASTIPDAGDGARSPDAADSGTRG